MRNPSEIFKAEAANKTTVTKKDGSSPFNATATTKPFNNPLRLSIKKPTVSDISYNTEKEANTKEFDLQQSVQKKRISSNAQLAAGYQNTLNSEKNLVSVGSNSDKEALENLEEGENYLNNELRKANSNVSSNVSSKENLSFILKIKKIKVLF
jgi:hypothetical protein